MVLRHQNGDLVVMKMLAPADNVDTSLEVHRLYMIVIVGVEIVLKIYLSEAYSSSPNNRHPIPSTDKFHCYFIFFIY